MSCVGNVVRMGQSRNAKTVERRPSGIPQHRWKDNTKMKLRETGGDSVDCFHLTLEKDKGKTVVDTAMNLRVP